MHNFTVTYNKFVKLCYELLDAVRESGVQYSAILCPLRGGFYLSYFMSVHLNLPVRYIEISSYTEKEQGTFRLGIKPDRLEGKYLLCDDIYDSGKTIRRIHAMFPEADFDPICLGSKVNDADVTYALLADNDRWVDFFWEIM
jgi:hypoxanthine phosphoribosyltransferase